MSDNNSSQEKTEKPSEKRLKKARRDGELARSKELNTAVLLLLGTGSIIWFSGVFFNLFRELMQLSFQLDYESLQNGRLMQTAIGTAIIEMLGAIVTPLVLMFLAMWISGSMPGGVNFSGKQASPQFNKLDPIKGFARMFSLNALVELAKSILKIVLLGGCLYLLLVQLWQRLIFLQRRDLGQALSEGFAILALCMMITVAVLIVVAVIDVSYQKHTTYKKIKMTRQEVKEERKSSDGSPEIKSRIRQIQYQISSRRIDDRVPGADVVITNPTHYAVAVRYAEKNAKAPYIVAKGVDEMALRIRAVAQRNEIEVLEIPALARAIYYSTRVDQEVPRSLYAAIAYVLTYVLQLKAYRRGSGQFPAPIPELEIPVEMTKRRDNRGI